MKISRSIITPLLLAGLFSLPSANGAAPYAANKKDKMPDMIASCSHQCPDAKTNDDVQACIEAKERGSKNGEKILKESDPTCYNAHEKYEGMMSQVTPNTQPYRYG
jgi:hypothetical protein